MKKSSPSSGIQTKLTFKKKEEVKKPAPVVEIIDDDLDDLDDLDLEMEPSPKQTTPKALSSNVASSGAGFKGMLKFSIDKQNVKPKAGEVDWSDDASISQAMHNALKNHFKLTEFRPNQFEIIFNLLKNKQDTFVLLPTGGGKSLCYQLPAVIFPGVTLVVSPLIALMHNQVQAMEHLGVSANYWNSSQKKSEITAIQKDLESGNPKLKLIYVTPELLTGNDKFQELMRLLASRDQLSLIAIDESHCISSWGHDFRKSFRQLDTLKSSFPQVPIIALTATATDKVRTDIVQSLKLRNPKCFITTFNRPNISYEIRYKDLLKNPYEDLCNFLKERSNDCGIIYCRTRNQVEELVSQLGNEKTESGKPIFSVKPYHAGVKLSERKTTQTDWLKGTTKIIVATIAFGMGIDKKDVRFVVHFALPKSLEGFYQESGRAGRDGKKSYSLMYHCGREKSSIQFLISRESKVSADRVKAIEQGFNKVCELCETPCCRRKFILEFFGESYDPSKPQAATTVTSPIKKAVATASSKQPLKFAGSSSKPQSSIPSTPPRSKASSSIEVIHQIKGVEFVDKCCDYCANPKKTTEEIKNATYTYSSGGLGSRLADDFISSSGEFMNEDFYSGVDDEYDGNDMAEFRREEEEDEDSFSNRFKKSRKGITNNSSITKSKPSSSSVSKSTNTEQAKDIKRKRMEDNIEDVLDALEKEESRSRKFSKPTSSSSSSLSQPGFVKASTLVTTTQKYRADDGPRKRTTTAPKTLSNLERFVNRK